MYKKPALLVAISLLGVAALGFLYGFFAAEYGLSPSATISRVEAKLRKLSTAGKGTRPEDSLVSTGLLRLNVRRIHVPSDIRILNGSLTAVEDGLLLMAGSGEVFFHARGASSVAPTGIRVPPNHIAEYEAIAATPQYAGYLQDFNTTFRYQHLLHVQSGAERMLFVSFIEWHTDNECYTESIARLDVTNQGTDSAKWSARPEDWRVIFRSQPCLPMKKKMRAIEAHMSGGRMAFDAAQQRLLLTTGDFHWDGVFNDVTLSQDDANDYGKLLSIDLDGKNAQHVARGLRNAQGITIDDAGRTWVTDHGPMGGDEINLIQTGSNYGWPLATLGKGYNGLPWKAARQYGRHDDFVSPVYAWIPSVGLSSIIQVRGFDAAWDRDFLVGSMGGNTLYRLRIVEGRVLFAEPIPFGERIRYILQPEDGVIALWTDSQNLILVTKAAADDSGAYVEHFIDQQTWADQRKGALRTALSACTQCHAYSPTPGSGAPHLVGVYNRSVASTEFPNYSAALRAIGGRWTKDALTGYLMDTQAFAPGSVMPVLNLPQETVQDLVTILEKLDAPD